MGIGLYGGSVEALTQEAFYKAQQEQAARHHAELQEANARHYEMMRKENERLMFENIYPPQDGYYSSLFRTTAYAATMEAHLEHPQTPHASAGAIQSGSVLMERDYAASMNLEEQSRLAAAQQENHIPTYHEDRPVFRYTTDLDQSQAQCRVHAEENKVREFSTRSADLNYGDITGSEAQSRLSLSYPPTQISEVHVPIGTVVEASMPISGEAWQFRIPNPIKSWFTNTRGLKND